jgi:hypothetical protein
MCNSHNEGGCGNEDVELEEDKARMTEACAILKANETITVPSALIVSLIQSYSSDMGEALKAGFKADEDSVEEAAAQTAADACRAALNNIMKMVVQSQQE